MFAAAGAIGMQPKVHVPNLPSCLEKQLEGEAFHVHTVEASR